MMQNEAGDTPCPTAPIEETPLSQAMTALAAADDALEACVLELESRLAPLCTSARTGPEVDPDEDKSERSPVVEGLEMRAYGINESRRQIENLLSRLQV